MSSTRRDWLKGAMRTGIAAGIISGAGPALAAEGTSDAQRRADEEEAARKTAQKVEKPELPYVLKKGKPKKALFVYGGWPGHQPEQNRDIFVPFLKKSGFEVVVSDKQDVYADEKLMESLDLIVQIWTMGTITGEQLKGLARAVNKRGVGLAGWHGGLGDSYRQEVEYQWMVGGQWVSHPGGIVPYRVHVTETEDPITEGLADFDLKSEQYYMHVDPNNKVLATTRFTGEHSATTTDAVMPVVWKKTYGRGRVFYTSMGHNVDVWDTPAALTIMKRGMLWASRSRFETTPSLITPVYPTR